MSYQNIHVETDKNIAIITINCPPLNKLNTQIYHELLSMIDKLEANNEISGIVITGGGEKAFVAGNNLVQMHQLNPIGFQELSTISKAALSRIERVSKPVVAAINGLALESGLELALACDHCICTENSTFLFPDLDHTKQNSSKTKRMQKVLKNVHAKDLVNNRRVFNANTALELQIVDHIVSEKDLISISKNLAGKRRLKDVI